MQLQHQRSTSSHDSTAKGYAESIHLIPTPGENKDRPRRVEHFILKPWVVFGLAILMIISGVVIIILLRISQHNHGFHAPTKNVFQGVATASFLTGFFPTLLIVPIVYAWHVTDWALRRLQPYVILADGKARVEDSLLLDYISMNQGIALWNSTRRRHWLILFSMLTAVVTNLFQPFAGALLSVKQIPSEKGIQVNAATTVGLSPDFATLNAFLAAAGFTEAAAFQGLPDPPFVHENWATSTITLPPNPGLNASLVLNTFGVRTNPNCENPVSVNLSTNDATNFAIAAATASGCSANVTFNPNSAEQQYGSTAVQPVSCGFNASVEQEFLPVMFWFFHLPDNTTGSSTVPQAKAVICSPTIELFNVEAKVDLSNSSLAEVTIISNYTAPNNVTGGDLNGKAFNGLALQQLAGPNNPFVSARATAIASGLPGAILRFAQQSGLQSFFDSNDAFLNLTTQIYTQHLSVSAKSIYFVPTSGNVDASWTSLVERIVIDELAAIALSALLILTGLIGLIVHFLHHRMRRRTGLHLTAEPGSIASSLALTSRSGFGELLVPYDNRKSMRQKLQHLRFSLDQRTGAIVAQEFDYEFGGRERGFVLGDYELPEERYTGVGGTANMTAAQAVQRSAEKGNTTTLPENVSEEVFLSPPNTAPLDTHPLVLQPSR
ncbi:hypothetical protein EIP91_003727 [Steccherinum ochraceum]|uniref:Uncharacterized protein n=1 Tax=Steccherinum ochraceum TaxID=92696 RepID=A0A4R0RUS8_9APHY|nr:hypothetical protein EIP91_003727 [Steccherinum ochraceum]